ncbi:bifunctional hydroxymethylpyrimidine kinase/phosphomethylpyrimidine kinase [Streptomyces sp. RerS4]|uniref:bifunctional hydroxymethylpyrimidine kinase/phosphomethylpyrimidine kinase n=1 Tax=Streptomyces sp. RerS4 TaxID=2942449 RepID=UPI00201C4BE0|nr:bifunctional hydroxymethylpyrimidine kinase/phosphomethylpyrimidine kinase [Streptomyces sp. RerS4]UQX03463.1 bifunctional hydroxymethylpyrimidine kinase/phosphomethylpyrimidine kinase [Streptomyces sp. RerS4]
MIPVALTIAGSDPSGGAGLQADLKVFSALGAYGTGVVTALTAQSTRGVSAVHYPPPEFLESQLDELLADVRIDTVKIGMLGDARLVEVVADRLTRHRPRHVVLDPVMVAKSGDRLLAADSVVALRTRLLPLVDLVTPNLPEAAELLGEESAHDEEGMYEQARRLAELCPRVLLKGGHLAGEDSVDLFREGERTTWLSAPRVHTKNTHGTGCALSSAIAALRPQRPDWMGAIADAKSYLTEALRHADSLGVGTGHGPPSHFHAWWPPHGGEDPS